MHKLKMHSHWVNLFCAWMNVDLMWVQPRAVAGTSTLQIFRCFAGTVITCSRGAMWVKDNVCYRSGNTHGKIQNIDWSFCCRYRLGSSREGRNGLYSPMSLLLVLPEVHLSIHLCFILLTVEKKHFCFSGGFLVLVFFFNFSGTFGGHMSAMGWDMSHGCVSFFLGLRVHARETLFSSMQNQ